MVARGYDILINVLGADHGGYVARMKAAVRAISHDKTKLEAVLCQIVHIMRGGEPVRMSKRAGTYVALRDLLEEVGRDAVRFTMLTRKADAQMEFDLNQAVAQTRDNPVFYVQYAHARCRSVLRGAAETIPAGDLLCRVGRRRARQPDRRGGHRSDPPPRLLAAHRGGGRADPQTASNCVFFSMTWRPTFICYGTGGRDDSTLRFLQADHPAETRARLAWLRRRRR